MNEADKTFVLFPFNFSIYLLIFIFVFHIKISAPFKIYIF
jgi:hypothetical protein